MNKKKALRCCKDLGPDFNDFEFFDKKRNNISYINPSYSYERKNTEEKGFLTKHKDY